MTVGVPRGLTSSDVDLVRERLDGEATFISTTTADAVADVLQGRLRAAVVRMPHSGLDDRLRQQPLATRTLGLLGSSATLNAIADADQGPVDLGSLGDVRLLWFDEARAPEYAQDVRQKLRAADWEPRLAALDPASGAVTFDALRHATDLVALRPQPTEPIPGLGWLPIQPELHETLVLVQAI